jgi:hypothetical protein
MDRLAAIPDGMLSVNSNILHLKIVAGQVGTILQRTLI